MAKSQDIRRGVARGDLTERMVYPSKGLGRAFRRSQEKENRKLARKQEIDKLRKERKLKGSVVSR